MTSLLDRRSRVSIQPSMIWRLAGSTTSVDAEPGTQHCGGGLLGPEQLASSGQGPLQTLGPQSD